MARQLKSHPLPASHESGCLLSSSTSVSTVFGGRTSCDHGWGCRIHFPLRITTNYVVVSLRERSNYMNF